MYKSTVSKKMKSFVATNTMKTMISGAAKGNQSKFNSEFFKFAKSKAFDCLFDFDTAVWKEGPTYLNCIYKEIKSNERRKK